jgi:uncharacterized RDD family membrane protein YckC
MWFAYVCAFGEEQANGSYSVSGGMALLLVAFWFIYFPVLEAATGQTIGKKVLGLKVVQASGLPIGARRAL